MNIENDDKWAPVNIRVVTDTRVAMGIVVKNKTSNIDRIKPFRRIIAISFLCKDNRKGNKNGES